MRKQDLAATLHFIQQQKPNFHPQIALILGSGLGGLADQIENPTRLLFSDIPQFPRSTVAGHKGQLVLGHLGNMPVACMQGRIHGYEGTDAEQFKIFIRILHLLGCHTLFTTNAAGSLRENVKPGELALISDHINFQHRNPLMGLNDDEFGPRFFAMTNAYDADLRQRFLHIAQQSHIKLTEGVYIGVNGPCFETPAEIRAFRTLGADLVAMSVIPETIIARHCGMRVAALSVIVNLAAGMSDEVLTHEGTLHFAKIGAGNLSQLIISVLESLAKDILSRHETREAAHR